MTPKPVQTMLSPKLAHQILKKYILTKSVSRYFCPLRQAKCMAASTIGSGGGLCTTYSDCLIKGSNP